MMLEVVMMLEVAMMLGKCDKNRNTVITVVSQADSFHNDNLSDRGQHLNYT